MELHRRKKSTSTIGTTTVVATAGGIGPPTGTPSGSVDKKPIAKADEKEEVTSGASLGNNRGGRGHVGRDGSVKVTVNGEVLANGRLAGGVVVVEKTSVTTGAEVGEPAKKAVPAKRVGIREKVLDKH